MHIKQVLILQREKLIQRFSKHKDNLKFPVDVNKKDYILICLPETNVNNHNLSSMIQDYKNLFLDYPIQFCASAAVAAQIPTTINCLYYNKQSLTLFHTLQGPINEQLKSGYYQIAIDLNFDFSLPAAVVCKSSNAPVRLSFKKPYADLFFNILIQYGVKNMAANTLKQQLNNLFKIIRSN